MNIQELNNLTLPLFEKHPNSKPKDLVFMKHMSGKLDFSWWQHKSENTFHNVGHEAAAHIITSHLVQWLAENAKEDVSIWPPTKGYQQWCVDVNGEVYNGITLIEALVNAGKDMK